jgi:hypothetical protein
MEQGPIKLTIRSQPTPELLSWRARFLQGLKALAPSAPTCASPVGLEPGNTKIGQSGTFYNSVFVWNLPAVATCPGASPWCLTHCYNADERDDVFPLDNWRENWAWLIHQPVVLRNHIVEQLKQSTGPCAVRIHSSGDFYSNEYIEFWLEIARVVPDVAFWAYTRSWTDFELLASLDTLRSMPNVQLFASCDNTMPPPPLGWRRSIVVDRLDELSGQNLLEDTFLSCPEQIGVLPNCASCAFCIDRRKGDVLFALH